jgi:hypothetical protein
MRISRCTGVVLLAFFLIGCSAANPIVSEWRNPAYSSGNFQRVVVGGLGEDTSVRRNFEDEFVTQLRAVGVDAVPSYRLLPESEKQDEAQLKEAAKKANVDAVLLARLIQVEQKSQYGGGYLPYTSFGIFGDNVGAAWHGIGGSPTVYRYKEYVSEATLHDVSKNDIVWTATIKTTEPENARTAIRSYVEAVMKALQEKNLIRKAG